MGWRFRKSFRVIPGVRLNLSRSGLSASVGGAPVTLNIGQHGLMGTVSIPGTGISYRQHFGSTQGDPQGLSLAPAVAPPQPSPEAALPPMQEVHSASTERLTSQSLAELKRLLQTTFEEREDILRELRSATSAKIDMVSRYERWNQGFLFKRVFVKKFAQRKIDADTATAKVAELEEQLRLTTIAAQIEMESGQAEPYFKMRDDFAALCECKAIWDVKAQRTADQVRERTLANTVLDRERVGFWLDKCDLIQWEQKVAHMCNAKGGEMFLYPGFILYRTAREAFSVIDYRDVRGAVNAVRFHEQDEVPSDSKTIGQTWAKCNKDGSRDRRFVNNFQIPIVLYGTLTLKSDAGLWEEFEFSSVERIVKFANSYNAFTQSIVPFNQQGAAGQIAADTKTIQ